MATKYDGIYNTTAPLVSFWPALVEPKVYKDKKTGKEGEPKFIANIGAINAQHPDLKGMHAMALKVAAMQWPGRDPKELKFPYTSGEKAALKAIANAKKDGKPEPTKTVEVFRKFAVVMKCASKYQPKLAILDHGKIIELETPQAIVMAKAQFYSGAESFFTFNFQPYDNPAAGDGITCYLNLVLSTGKGAKIGGGPSAAESFKHVAGYVSAEDPTAGMDDEIPF